LKEKILKVLWGIACTLQGVYVTATGLMLLPSEGLRAIWIGFNVWLWMVVIPALIMWWDKEDEC